MNGPRNTNNMVNHTTRTGLKNQNAEHTGTTRASTTRRQGFGTTMYKTTSSAHS